MVSNPGEQLFDSAGAIAVSVMYSTATLAVGRQCTEMFRVPVPLIFVAT